MGKPAQKFLLVSDFDGAVTPGKKWETNSVLLCKADPDVSHLRRVMMDERQASISLLGASGLLALAPQVGFSISKNGKFHVVKRADGRAGCTSRKRISPSEMPDGISDRMLRYYGRRGPTVPEFFTSLLYTDAALEKIFSGAKDVMDVHDRQFDMMLQNEIGMKQFHFFLDTVYSSFLTKAHIDAASKALAEEAIRPGMENALSATIRMGGQVVFCSYSYVQVIDGVARRLAHRMGKGHSGKIHCVANNIVFCDGRDGGILRIDRVGDKWNALDAFLARNGFPKKGAKYENGVCYDDGEYNLPDMAKRFPSIILLSSYGDSKKAGAAEKYASYKAKYPHLRVCAETAVSGVESLGGIIMEEFAKVGRKK